MFDLEVGVHARAPRLRRQHQVVIPAGGLTAFRDDIVEQEAVILAEHHQHRGAHVHRVAGCFVRLDLPAVDQFLVDAAQLFTELVRGCALQRHFDPVQRGSLGDVVGHQPRRLGVVEIGHDDDARRMLDKAVGQLLQRQAHVFETDFLADDEERDGRKTPMQGTHHVAQHGAVADPGVEQPQRRRRWADMRQLLRGTFGHFPFFVAGVDESQVFLAIVVEPKRPIVGYMCHAAPPGFCLIRSCLGLRNFRFAGIRLSIDVISNPLRGFKCHILAGAQTSAQLAIVDRLPAEGRFGQAGRAAVLFYFF